MAMVRLLPKSSPPSDETETSSSAPYRQLLSSIDIRSSYLPIYWRAGGRIGQRIGRTDAHNFPMETATGALERPATAATNTTSSLPSPSTTTTGLANPQPPQQTPLADWERKPTLIPVTVNLGKRKPYNHNSTTDHVSVGLDLKSEANIMHMLNSNKALYDQFTKVQAEKLARATQGDALHIYKQLDAINELFKDGDRRSNDPRIFTLNYAVPIMDGCFLVHRCLWDLWTPLAYLDVYCQEVCGDLGLSVDVARALRTRMATDLNFLRKELRPSSSAPPKSVPEGFVEVETATGEAVIRPSRIKFPLILKGSADEAAALEAKMRAAKDVDELPEF